MSEPILKEKDGDVTTITLNRPEVGNRQTDATWARLTEMLEIDAHKALVFGLVSNVVPANELDAAVASLVERFKKTPLPALLAVKEYAGSAFSMSTRAANDFARNLHATINSFSGMRP